MSSIQKVLKQLTASALFDASKERLDLSIRRLCEEIQDKKIVLPVFQTYIRWTDKKVAELFNYQLHGKAPMAPISVNVINKPEKVVEQMNFLTREILDGEEIKNKISVADGQQRLSANYNAYINNIDYAHIVLDLKKGKFIVNEIGTSPESHQIPVGILYNKEQDVFKNYISKVPFLNKEEVKDVLSEIRRKHFAYTYVVNQATDLSRKAQMEWFEVLNLAGSQVTETMVYLSDLLTKGVDFYTYYVYPFADKLEESGFGDLFPRKSSEVSIPLATLNSAYFKYTGIPKTSNSSPIPSDAKPKAIGKLEVQDIIKLLDETLEALDKVLAFINSDEKIKKPERLDVVTYLVGLFVECEVETMNDVQRNFLTNWCNDVNFVNNSNKLRRNKFESLIEDYKKL
ncbi:TPA: hypothetical protein ROY14_001441 [Bacillus mobilis]|uniref:GmrSD restriction endonuclease domain-containing protein n=1 Tax=Bacillus mobilis TaxID=2026190 RepID=UPI0011A47607|nr:DUF262 domain-containing protein [Bacillus mobilis]HDX9639382.1 hypothetical protein [Bacillus mobilis]